MANFVWLLAAIFVACIASSSGCGQEIAKCSAIVGGQATGQMPKDMSMYCSKIEKAKKCFQDLDCPEMKSTIDTMLAGFSQTASVCKGAGGSSGGAGAGGSASGADAEGNGGDIAKCSLLDCNTEDVCQMFECITKKNGECKDDEGWKAMFTGQFKKKYDEAAEKCGCGSLKSSLLFVMVSAILVFLRSHF